MQIDKHMTILGTTDTGKTYYALNLFKSQKGVNIFFNTAYEPIAYFYGTSVARDADELENIIDTEGRDKYIVFMPSENPDNDLQAITNKLKYIGEKVNEKGHRKRWVRIFIDETHLFGGKQGTPALNWFFTNGLRYGIVCIAISQRPALISHTALTQSTIHVYFDMQEYEAPYFRKYGFDYEEHKEHLREPYHYVIQRGTHCTPYKPVKIQHNLT